MTITSLGAFVRLCDLRTALLGLAFTVSLAPLQATASSPTAERLAKEAKEALDTHYGDSAQLSRAAALLTRAIALDKELPLAYVQAARLTVKGGHIVETRFQPGTLDAYGELLDRALALEPANAKANILKAEYFRFKGNHDLERAALDRARNTGTTDAWLLVGYGRMHRELDDVARASAFFSEVRLRGPGSTSEERNAYVAALDDLANLAARSEDKHALRELIGQMRSGRDKRDAWALGNLADSLVWAGMFEEAISVGREALKTMNYGAGRLTLASALFGRAAELRLAGQDASAARLLAEARSYGYSNSSILRRFNPGSPSYGRLLPRIREALE